MFKKTNINSQLSIFSSAESNLKGTAKRFYNNVNSWHNVFRNQVYSRVDESIFSVLYSGGMGAPNASIRTMISMMIIKEGHGYSDDELFEDCHFNSLTRAALGLFNNDDTIPTKSTYYSFRKRVAEYDQSTGENLIETAFASITKGQAYDFKVSGKSIRMDSKLIGSNIAWYSRYEIVHESLRLFWKEQAEILKKDLDQESIEQLDSILIEKGNKVVYRSSNNEIKPKLQELGVIIYKLLQLPSLQQSNHQKTLSLVFEQQFKFEEEIIIARPKEEIKADSIQSPHDTDADYRDKDGNKKKGFSENVTESCGEKLRLISNIETSSATTADCHLLENGVKKSEDIFGEKAEFVHTDGAYHSPENQKFCENNGTDLIIPKIQGAQSRYDLTLLENNELTVKDTETDEYHSVHKVKDKEKWRIITENGYRYFTIKDIETCQLRKKLKQIPVELLNIRNNVEATIFQLGFHYPNDKTRYRGLSKHKMWANFRGLWINFVRIKNYLIDICQRSCFLSKIALNLFFEKLFWALNLLIINFYHYRLLCSPKRKFLVF